VAVSRSHLRAKGGLLPPSSIDCGSQGRRFIPTPSLIGALVLPRDLGPAVKIRAEQTHPPRMGLLAPPPNPRTCRVLGEPTLPFRESLGPPSARQPTMEFKIPSLEEIFLANLHDHTRRGTITQDLTQGLSVQEMMQDLQSFLSNNLAQGTWTNYGRAWAAMRSFAESVPLPVCEYTAALFLRRRMLTPYRQKNGKMRYYLISSIYGQSKAIQAVGNRLSSPGWQQGILTCLNRVLVKMGAKIPTFQAQPITRSQVYSIVDNSSIPEHQRIILLITWKCAGRADDMEKALSDDCAFVKHEGVEYLVIRWRPQAKEDGLGHLKMPGSGCLKNLTHGLGSSCVVDCGEYLQRVKDYIRSRKGLPLSPYTTEQVTAFLKKHVSPDLSAHSVKRGALQHLLEVGVDIRLVIEVARHSPKIDWIPMATRTYLQSIALALAIGTQKATRLL